MLDIYYFASENYEIHFMTIVKGGAYWKISNE